jgi:hypothetical protein
MSMTAQRARWFKRGFDGKSMTACDSFQASAALTRCAPRPGCCLVPQLPYFTGFLSCRRAQGIPRSSVYLCEAPARMMIPPPSIARSGRLAAGRL